MTKIESNVQNEITTHSTNDTKQFLLTNVNYELITQCQKRIFETTEVSPSIRKLINAIINTESVDQLEKSLIDQLK